MGRRNCREVPRKPDFSRDGVALGGRELRGFISDEASFDAGSHPAEAILLPHPRPLASSSERRTGDPVSPDASPLSPGDAASLARGERGAGVLTQPGASRRVPAAHPASPGLRRAPAHPTPIRSRVGHQPLPSPSRCDM